jgi:5-methylthioadenosine/S-adenosylhomocysteine deaminase
MTEILIKNGFIVTMDKERKVYPKGRIGKNIEKTRSPEYVIDAENKLVMPGFVNIHTHMWQEFRGIFEVIGGPEVNMPSILYRSPDDM